MVSLQSHVTGCLLSQCSDWRNPLPIKTALCSWVTCHMSHVFRFNWQHTVVLCLLSFEDRLTSNMSFVALKTFLLPPKRCHIKPHETKRMEGQQSGETESQDAVPIPPFTEKSSERSWLSCNSSIDIEDQKLSRSFLPQDSLPSTASIQNRSLLAKMKISPSPRMISDAIIGVSDGLTVPFALTAGLASFADTHIVILGGVAELVAGMISMGLGGLLGAQSEALVKFLERADFRMVRLLC